MTGTMKTRQPTIKTLGTKKRLIYEILDNPTYTSGSGVYQIVGKSLLALSLDSLRSLKLIIDLKCDKGTTPRSQR